MTTRRSFLWALSMIAAVAAAAGFASSGDNPQGKTAVAKVGKPAPDFTLKDAEGKAYKLPDYKGKIVVLQWINPDCPVCRRVCKDGVVRNAIKELKALDKDYVHLAINSTHYMDPEAGAKYLKSHKIDVPALSDADGTVGHLYDARTTPHLFVIDKKGILRYSGALDDDPRGRKGDEATNYVVNAVRQIIAGEEVSPGTTKPYGCSVKYKKN